MSFWPRWRTGSGAELSPLSLPRIPDYAALIEPALLPLFVIKATMIRPLLTTDLDAAVELWYQASVQAHDFIPAAFWHAQRAAMRDIYLTASQSWVYEEDGQ
ncbi:MAG: hypothetical protein ACRDCT_16780, partial [Shewanella sp.]